MLLGKIAVVVNLFPRFQPSFFLRAKYRVLQGLLGGNGKNRKVQVRFAAALCSLSLLLLSLIGCSQSHQVEWRKFEEQRMINNLKSQENALKILRVIQSEDPDAIYKGSSLETWIDQCEATVRVYREREKINESMWAY